MTKEFNAQGMNHSANASDWFTGLVVFMQATPPLESIVKQVSNNNNNNGNNKKTNKMFLCYVMFC